MSKSGTLFSYFTKVAALASPKPKSDSRPPDTGVNIRLEANSDSENELPQHSPRSADRATTDDRPDPENAPSQSAFIDETDLSIGDIDPTLEPSRISPSSSGLSGFETPPIELPLALIQGLDGSNDHDATDPGTEDDDLPPMPMSKSSHGSRTKSYPRHFANTSFQTTSTLSAPPPSSQLSRSSSRRIVRDGVPLVTNSSPDHTPVELNTDSDSDLEDLNASLVLHKRQQESPPTSNERPQRRHLRSRPQPRLRSQLSSTREPPRKKLKFDFQSIVKSAKHQAESSARVKALEDSVMELDKAAVNRSTADAALENGLQAAVAGDANATFKLKSAIRRFDAFEKATTFHFFDAPARSTPTEPLSAAVANAWPWSAVLQDTEAGPPPLMLQFIKRHVLPRELVTWIKHNALSAEDPAVAQAYISLLESRSYDTTEEIQCLGLDQLQTSLENIGVRQDIVTRNSKQALESNSIAGHHRPDCAQKTRLANLASIFRVFASRLDRQTCEHSIVSFCLAMVDDDLRFDRDIKTVLLDALSALLCRYQEPDNGTDQPYSLEQPCKKLLTLLSEILLKRLLDSLLSSHTTVAAFRRQLAYTSVTSEPVSSPRDLYSADCWTAVLRKLVRSTRFAVNGKTDYVALTARIEMLDIAIGPGFVDPAILALDAPSGPASGASTLTETSLSSSRALFRSRIVTGTTTPINGVEAGTSTPLLSAPAGAPAATGAGVVAPATGAATGPGPGAPATGAKAAAARSTTKAFNAAIDATLNALKATAGHIRDAGAAHMHRTECKSAIDRVMVRLEFGLRTRPRPRRLVFGNHYDEDGGNSEGREDVLARFVGIAPPPAAPPAAAAAP